MSRIPTPAGGGPGRPRDHLRVMETAQPQSLTALGIIVVAALAIIVVVFLKMSGVIRRRGHKGEGRSPPPPPAG